MVLCRRSFRDDDKSFAAKAAPTKPNQPAVGGPLGPKIKTSQLKQLLQNKKRAKVIALTKIYLLVTIYGILLSISLVIA